MEPAQLLRFINTVEDYALIVLDNNLNIQYYNKGAELLLKGNNGKGNCEDFAFLHQPNNEYSFISSKIFAEARINKKAVYQGWLNRNDETKFLGNVSVSLNLEDKKNVIGYTLIIRDITQQQAREDYIKNIEDRHHRMINEVEDYAILLLSKEGFVQNWNKGAEKLKGYTVEEIIGKNFEIFYTKQDIKKDLPKTLLKRALETGHAHQEGWRMKKDGSKFWANVSITCLHDSTGNAVGFSKVTRDLTERMQAEVSQNKHLAALKSKNKEIKRLAESHYKMINEVEDYAILLLSKEGFVQNWNKGAEKLKGYTVEEIIGKNFKIFYPEEDIADQLPQKLLKQASDVGRAEGEGWRVKKDGSKFWASVIITALHDDKGNVIGYSKVTRDLTERRIAEENQKNYLEQLENKNKDLEQIVYITSHDLQEPLRTIRSFIDLFTEEFTAEISGDAGIYLKFIKEAAERMSCLIKTLLDYALLGKEKDSSEIDVNEVLKDLITDLTLLIKNTETEVIIEPLPRILGYRTEIGQLFQNLISNAIKFRKSDTSPKINIRATLKDDFYEFAISDNGIGIEPAYHEKIFMIFQRLHSRKDYEGIGIGLANCKKIVELHGGRLWVNSSAGKGATFRFTIPYKRIL